MSTANAPTIVGRAEPSKSGHFNFVRLACTACVLLSAAIPSDAFAQAGLRESLEKLDTNEDGEISPDEITPLARPYLERIAKSRRMSLDRDNDIDKLQEAARIYHALKNGVAGSSVRPERQGTIRRFGPADDEPYVPQFGLAKIKYPYTEDDIEEAEDTLRRSDRDRDGFIDRYEARRARWTHLDPFESDLNNDNQLSKLELVQRYARRRLLSDDSDELVQKARRVGNGIRDSDPKREDRRERDDWWRRGGTSYWLSASLMTRFDVNKNGRLDSQESQALGFPATQVDADRDGELSRDEIFAYVKRLQDEAGDPVSGLPGWFYELDTNRDQQVAMSEFAEEWTDERVEEFVALDLNEDGLLTPSEVVRSKSNVGGSYENSNAEMLPPERSIVSEIEVTDDYAIRDLNVQISITHSNAAHLDGFLTGPDGTRIELFTEVGGRDNNFQGTIFDDQAREPINKARPPFEGRYLPEGLVKRQPGLAAFNGKTVKGVWQLVIRGVRSDRFGMLHWWKIMVEPQDDLLDQRQLEMTGTDSGESTSQQTNGTLDQPTPVSAATTSPARAVPLSRPEPTGYSAAARPAPTPAKLDYAEIGRKIESAVSSGKMNRQQATEMWRSIKERAKAKASRGESPSGGFKSADKQFEKLRYDKEKFKRNGS